MSTMTVSIQKHTTTSIPRPHVVYCVDVVRAGGQQFRVEKRYSDFVELQATLGDQEALPPKRILVTSFLPSAWVDDQLIAERKAGLAAYLNKLLASPYSDHSALIDFLSISSNSDKEIGLEDALPSTLSREAALEAQATITASSLVAAAYYPYWAADSLSPETLDYSKFDILFFAFAAPNASSGITYDNGFTSILERVVTAARNSGKGTKIVLSIGGWSGSHYFSQAVSSSSNISAFVNAVMNAIKTYNLDGVDIDWEYPNSEGAGNPHSSSDSANFLTFLTSLRAKLGPSKIISAAVTHSPWLGSNGKPLSDVSAYAAPLSYINIMNYDVWGASSTPGPNAPLGNLCGTSRQPEASAEAAFAQWSAAGFPANKMLLGLPLYGYVSQSTATTLTGIAIPPPGFNVQKYRRCVMNLPARNPAPMCPFVREKLDEEPDFLDGQHDRVKHREVMHKAPAGNGDLSAYWGHPIAFSQIVSLGALTKTASGAYAAANGYTFKWDDCSDTPFIFDQARKTVVTYDDPGSLGDKAAYAKSIGMAGCMTWSLNQDDNYTLQDAIRKSLGK